MGWLLLFSLVVLMFFLSFGQKLRCRLYCNPDIMMSMLPLVLESYTAILYFYGFTNFADSEPICCLYCNPALMTSEADAICKRFVGCWPVGGWHDNGSFVGAVLWWGAILIVYYKICSKSNYQYSLIGKENHFKHQHGLQKQLWLLFFIKNLQI